MRIRFEIAIIALFTALSFSSRLSAQTGANPAASKPQKEGMMSGGIPDLSGLWEPDFRGPESVRINTWDSSDLFAAHPEKAPMTPWAAAKFKDARPPFGAMQTFDNTNDPVQRFCDPPGIPRIYMYPWIITFIQTPKIVYILYEYTKVWRAVAMNAEHPKDPDITWMGDAVGKYEGDTFVVNTIGLSDKTWLDQAGHPHSDALHVIERFRRLNVGTMELGITIDDPKAYTKPWSVKFNLGLVPDTELIETVCENSRNVEHMVGK